MHREDWNRIWGDVGHGHHDHEGEHAEHHHDGSEPDGLLTEVAGGLPTGRALDLGCGLGSNSIWLARQGWSAEAVDFSDAAIERARHHAASEGVEVSFRVADLTTLAPTGRYDLVTLFYVHLPPTERQAVLERVARAVAPGGHLLFVGHDRSDSAWFEQHIRGHRDDQDHADGEGPDIEKQLATLTDPDEVAAELPGLTILRAEIVPHDAHGTGERVGTTLVLAHRPEQG